MDGLFRPNFLHCIKRLQRFTWADVLALATPAPPLLSLISGVQFHLLLRLVIKYLYGTWYGGLPHVHNAKSVAVQQLHSLTILVYRCFHHFPEFRHVLIDIFALDKLVVTHCGLHKGHQCTHFPVLCWAEWNKLRERYFYPLPQGHLKCSDDI